MTVYELIVVGFCILIGAILCFIGIGLKKGDSMLSNLAGNIVMITGVAIALIPLIVICLSINPELSTTIEELLNKEIVSIS